MGRNKPYYAFLGLFMPETQSSPVPKLKLHLHLTKSPKRDNIYRWCLYMLEEHNYLILISSPVPKLRYSTHAPKI